MYIYIYIYSFFLSFGEFLILYCVSILGLCTSIDRCYPMTLYSIWWYNIILLRSMILIICCLQLYISHPKMVIIFSLSLSLSWLFVFFFSLQLYFRLVNSCSFCIFNLGWYTLVMCFLSSPPHVLYLSIL